MDHGPLDEVLILLLLSVGAVVLMRRLQLTPILGYLLVGAVVGEHALGWVPDSATIHLLAEIGVAFLLFAIGLEFSIPQLMSMRGVVFGLGGAQVALTTLLLALVLYAMGYALEGAAVMGGALALSSTAIVLKQLTEQLEVQTRHGRLAIGILLFQDLAVVPLLVVIPILAMPGEGPLAWPLLVALLKASVAFGAMIALGHWVLRPLFHVVAAGRSAELFTLTVLLVSLTAAWVTSLLGLSFALGAFLAGMMLSETEYRHQIESDVRPFRDVLLGLFFITVGTRLDVAVLPQVWAEVLLLVALLLLGKAAIVFALTRVSGHGTAVSVRTALILAQAGEFGFVLIALALQHGLLPVEQSHALLLSMVLSMALAPLVIRSNGPIAERVCARAMRRERDEQARTLEQEAEALRAHTILCGFGRVGQNLGRFLREQGFEYVALDLDPVLVREAWQAGERVFYADATQADILEAAGLGHANAVAVLVADPFASERIVEEIRASRADLPILVRIRDESQMERLERLGATEVVPETLEASLMMAEHLLARLGVGQDEIARVVERVRTEHYRNLRGFFHGESSESVEEVDPYHLHTVLVTVDCHADGRQLGELGLGDMGIEVQALRRGEVVGEAPEADTQLRAGDALVLLGAPEQLEHAEQRILQG
ncbi:MAG: monovalent cation:proton antiporter-2 (CPA2) family protein [Chromatiales bacterium]